MTGNLAQMSADLANLNANIAGMGSAIGNMAVDVRQMNRSPVVITYSMGHLGNDINKFSNPKRMMPFVP